MADAGPLSAYARAARARARQSRAAGGPCIYVLAGTNGAGKSSVGGAAFRARGAEYFNPDEAAARIRVATPELTSDEANSAAWLQGKRLLERAIAERLDFAIETTLGGETMTDLLAAALRSGIEVRVWYVGVDGPEQHIARVRARVARGGHDIPDAMIRTRFDRSRINLIRLLPALTELRVYDNSADADPATGAAPVPMLVAHVVRGTRVFIRALPAVPQWAKPIVAAALKLRRATRTVVDDSLVDRAHGPA